MPAKFGTSGLRGLVGELDDGTAAAHAAAFLRHLKAEGVIAAGGGVFVGRDLRPSSPHIAAQIMAAVEDEHFVPVDCGALPTPALAAFAMARGAACVMVTGSHIPADRNGVKFYRPDGEIDKVDEVAIAAGVGAVERPRLRPAPHAAPTQAGAAACEAYLARYRGFVADGALDGRRIGVYEHSTVLRDLVSALFAASGCEIVSLGRSDVFVPVDTEAVGTATRDSIRGWTQRYRLDALISADGDADRPLLADETGACIRGDVLGLLVARHLGADAVVTPVTSNSGIEARLDARVRRTRVGSPYVIAGMAEVAGEGAAGVVGFEANGGVLTGSAFSVGAARLAPLPTRDSILPLLTALSMSLGEGRALSELVASLGLPVAESGRIENFASERGGALIAALTDEEEARVRFLEPLGKAAHIDVTDGLRMTLADGRILHLRPSGNAPEMRIYAEAESEAAATALVEAVRERIPQFAG